MPRQRTTGQPIPRFSAFSSNLDKLDLASHGAGGALPPKIPPPSITELRIRGVHTGPDDNGDRCCGDGRGTRRYVGPAAAWSASRAILTMPSKVRSRSSEEVTSPVTR